LSRGIIEGKKVREELKIEQILESAEIFWENQKFKIGEEFFEVAIKKSKSEEKFKILTKYFHLAIEDENLIKAREILTEIENFKEEIQYFNERIQNFNEELQKLKEIFSKTEKKVLKFGKNPPKRNHQTEVYQKLLPFLEKIYLESCRGQRTQNSSTTSKLFCKLHSTSEFTKISPFKVEILNFEPFVAIYLDVITENEIEVIKNLSKNQMERAGVVGVPVTPLKVSKAKILSDSVHEKIRKLSKRAGDMTGLDVENAGVDFKVHNYGMGGQYHLHYDFRYDEDVDKEFGNRVVTVLFYVRNFFRFFKF
jgi:prolyl 4-hydroxylase